MAQLPPIGLPWPLTKPPFGGCAIYVHYGVEGFPIEDGMATYQKIDSSTVWPYPTNHWFQLPGLSDIHTWRAHESQLDHGEKLRIGGVDLKHS